MKVEKILDYYLEFIIGIGKAGVIVLGIYFVIFRQFPSMFNSLNEPLITFIMGYLFFDLLCSKYAKNVNLFKNKKVKYNKKKMVKK